MKNCYDQAYAVAFILMTFFLSNRHVGKSRVHWRRYGVTHVRQEAFQTHMMPIFAVHTPHARASGVLWWYLERPPLIASVGTVFLGNHVSVENTTQPRNRLNPVLLSPLCTVSVPLFFVFIVPFLGFIPLVHKNCPLKPPAKKVSTG